MVNSPLHVDDRARKKKSRLHEGGRWLCGEHLPDDAGKVLDRIDELRRKA